MLNKRIIEARVNIDALNAATRLASVVTGAIHEVFDGAPNVGVSRDIRRILAAKFKANIDETIRRDAAHLAAAAHRAGKGDVIDPRVANDFRDPVMPGYDLLDQIRNAHPREPAGQPRAC